MLIVVFVAATAIPGLGTTLGLGRGSSVTENRALARLPTIQWMGASIRDVPDQWVRYFEDNFAFRQLLVRWQAAFRLNVLGVSPSEAVIKGRDGWLFYAQDGALQDYVEERLFTPRELEIWRQTLQDTNDRLGERGVVYLFVVSPDKHLVYPEFMPRAIRGAATSRIDQLIEYLATYSTVTVLDLRPALLDAKSHERLYHRTDTHWNDRGAFVAYQQIMTALGKSLPGLSPVSRALFEPRHVESAGLDLAGMMGLTQVLREEDLLLTPKQPFVAHVVEPNHPSLRFMDARVVTEVPDGHRPRAVIFRDSFGSALIPFLSEHFSRAVYLWQYNVEPDVITGERPDVVIQEWVGRRLTAELPYNPWRQTVPRLE
jgi:hypothetical protein